MLSILCLLLLTRMMLMFSILIISTLVVILFKFFIGIVLYMEMRKLPLRWFSCDIELTLRLAGQTRVVRSHFDFYCAFSLRALRSCVNLTPYLPNRFCSAELSFDLIDPVLAPDFSNRLFHMRSYQDIIQFAIRNIIYTLTIDRLIYEFQVDKTL